MGVFDQLMVITGGTGCFYGLTGTILGDSEGDNFVDEITIDEGFRTLSAQGFFRDMIIVGGSGCFRGLKGRVRGSQGSETEFGYAFLLD